MRMKIGFIGQGWIGKNYADNFEKRGFAVVRYSLEEPHVKNGDKIGECDIVFIAVPTPTTPKGFDASIVEESLALIADKKIAVIKSTMLPGTTKRLQAQNPKITVLYSPEFLSEATAAHDAARPFSNIIGIPEETKKYRAAAEKVLKTLPEAPFSLICDSDEAEIIKYAHNVSGYAQIVTFNLIYDLAHSMGHDWKCIGEALMADPFISNRYANPVHKSGRGAGGNCFIKDFAAFAEFYKQKINDPSGSKMFRALEEKNINLLVRSDKDISVLKNIYGDKIIDSYTKN